MLLIQRVLLPTWYLYAKRYMLATSSHETVGTLDDVLRHEKLTQEQKLGVKYYEYFLQK